MNDNEVYIVANQNLTENDFHIAFLNDGQKAKTMYDKSIAVMKVDNDEGGVLMAITDDIYNFQLGWESSTRKGKFEVTGGVVVMIEYFN